MKRRLTRAEIEAQLAEKKRRIDQHLEAMKEQSEVVADSLKERARKAGARLQEAGDKAREAGEQALELAPLALAGGVGLFVAGKLLGRLFRRRRPAHRMTPEEIAVLSEAVARRIALSGVHAPPAAIPPTAPAPKGGGKDELVRLLLAGLAGVALKVAADHVPWAALWDALRKRLAGETLEVEEPVALPATTGSRAPIRPRGRVPRPGKASPAEPGVGVAPPPPGREPGP